MKTTLIAMLAVAILALQPAMARAQDENGDGSKSIVLADPDHPLNGQWQVVHEAGTIVCPQMTMAIPAGNPETVDISVFDGGATLETSAPSGHMTLRRVASDAWESTTEGDAQVLRRKLRDDANWMAWALEGTATIYEGSQTPSNGMTIRYILGWAHDTPGEMSGHLTSSQQGCKVTRAFKFRR